MKLRGAAGQIIDRSGQSFGGVRVVGTAPNSDRAVRWRCVCLKCECELIVYARNIPYYLTHTDAVACKVCRPPRVWTKRLTEEQRQENAREYYNGRARRHRDQRAVTVNLMRMSERERVHLRVMESPTEPYWKPKTRGECTAVSRPCPFVSCRWHLYLDARSTGNLKLNFPDLEPDELTETCTLDVADRGGATLEDVGAMMNITRERIRQLEVSALAKLSEQGVAQELGVP